MKRIVGGVAGLTLLLLAGCSARPATSPNVPVTVTTTAAPVTTTTEVGMVGEQSTVHAADVPGAWIPEGMEDAGDGLAFAWKKDATSADCKSYQEGCFVAMVASESGCPGGIYIAASIKDRDGIVVGKANDITAGLGAGDVAKVPLEMPGGHPQGAKASISELNCLGD